VVFAGYTSIANRCAPVSGDQDWHHIATKER